MSAGSPPPERHPYTAEGIKAALRTTMLGVGKGRIELHQQVASTNDLAREAGRRGEPEGLVVLAEEQLAGRGRLGRTWSAPPACCILCSLLLRPRFPPEHAFYLTIATSLAIYRACHTLLKDQGPGIRDQEAHAPNSALSTQHSALTIKWPNDVRIGGRKVAGVLSESEFSGGEWAFAVVGFGINANLRPDQLAEIGNTATSLSAELGRQVDQTTLLAHVLFELESLYFSLQNGQFSLIYNQWVSALDSIGRHVSVTEPGGKVTTGHALRVDPDGALVIRLDDGTQRRVLAGDVTTIG